MTTLLFLDDWPLHVRRDLVRRPGTPRWVPEATLEDDLFEGTWNYPFVRHDAAAGVWRAWYAGVAFLTPGSPAAPPAAPSAKPALAHDPGVATGIADPGGPGTARGARRQFLGLLYAESPDGVHWAKPDLSSRSPLAVRRRPNQVFSYHDRYSDGGPVYYDAHDPDASRRYKYLFSTRDETGAGTEWLATSPDGLRWSLASEPWGRRSIDTLYGVFRNRQQGCYGVICRPDIHDRRVALLETADFRHFSPPRVIVHPDPLDPPLTQFYGMPVSPYEGLYLGLLQMYHADPEERGGHKLRGYVDGALTYSYDGRAFNRTWREPFLPRTPRGEPGSGGVYPCTLLIDGEHRVRIYSAGARATHFQSRSVPDAALLLHTLRLDGFASLDADAGTGFLQTRRLRFSGPDLRLNVSAPHGRVRVQLSAEDGAPIPGYTFDECVPFTGDDLFYRPHWQGGASPAALSGRLVHLDVELAHGGLYAVRGDFELVVSVPPTRGVS